MKKKISIYASLTVLLSPSIVMAEEVITSSSTSSSQHTVIDVSEESRDMEVTIFSDKDEISKESSEDSKVEKIVETKKRKRSRINFL